MTTRILLADDHTLVRAGLRALLDEIPGVSVIAEAANGEEALRQARECQPDLVLMDIAMPTLGGLEAAARLRDELPETRVIILSMHATDDYVAQAIRAGASGYILKDAATAELALAIDAVARGGKWISPAVSSRVIDRFLAAAPATAADPLTPRQREILVLLAEGLGTKEIAYRLGLSSKTVETHRAQLMERLGVRDLASLVRYAVKTGLVSDR